MRKGLLMVAALLVAVSASAQTPTTIILTPTSALQFDPSPQHNTVFAGTPVVSGYKASYCLKDAPATCPIVVNLGKPAPDATGKITVANVFGTILPNTEYVAWAIATGPGGDSVPSNTTDPFGVPGAPQPPANVAVRKQ